MLGGWVPPEDMLPPRGFTTCFNGGGMTFERCCGAIWSRAPEPVVVPHSVGHAPPPRAGRIDDFTVDILVRTFYGDSEMLELLLESVRLFWPMRRWQSRVIVVLDSESTADHALCRRLPTFVECRFEDDPAFLPAPAGGIVRAMWSLFYADIYSDAEWVAIMDADALFLHVWNPPSSDGLDPG